MLEKSAKPKKKSLFKKLLIAIGFLFIVIILLAISIPYFFSDDIKAYINKEISDNIDAKVDYDNIELSLLKSFPNLNTSISDIKIQGINNFSDKELFKADEINLELDIMSLFSDKIQIVDFTVVKPLINVIVLPDGKANYDIVKDTKGKTENEDFSMKNLNLKHYSILDANIKYIDLQSKKGIKIRGLNHKGSGDFKDIKFKLITSTKIDSLSFKSDGITLLKNANLDWDINFDVDLEKMLFDIKENILKLNELKLISQGKFILNDDFIDFDFKLSAPGNSFKEIYSIIPLAYTKDFKDIKTSGTYSFIGDIKGKLFYEKEIYPDFNFKINLNNGYVKSPEMPLPIEKINSDILIKKVGKSLNNTIIDINPMEFFIEGEKMSMIVNIKNLLTNPLSKGIFKGSLNLGILSKAFPVEDLKQLSGYINTDLRFNFNQSMTTKELDGYASIKNIKAQYSDFPDVLVSNANTKFSNQLIKVNDLTMKLGDSDLSSDVSIQNPLNYFSKNKIVGIEFNGKSKFFNADEWMQESSDDKASEKIESDDGEFNALLKNRIALGFKYSVEALKYDDFDLKNLNVSVNYQNNTLEINKQDFDFSGSKFNIHGRLDNIISWVLENKELKGIIDVKSSFFDMDKFMGDDSNTNKEGEKSEEDSFVIPDKMNLLINANIDQIKYDNKDLRNLKGRFAIENQTMVFKDLVANGMGGTMNMKGSFSTPPNEPANFDINYKISNMKYEEMYKSVLTYKIFSPVSKFISGIFNANFSFKGKMQDGFTPDLKSINASGLIHTLNAYIKNYPPLNSLASKLQVKSLKNFEIKDSKNRFDIVDGTVRVNPFDVSYDDMKFNISGTNKFDKTIDYIIHAKIPKSKIDKLPGAKNLDKGLGFISSKAKDVGVDFEIGNVINLDFSVVGQYDKPELRIKFVGTSKGNIKNNLKEETSKIVDKAKEDAKKEAEKAKKEAEDKAKEIINDTKKKAKKKIDETKNDVKKKIDKKIEETKNKAKKKLKDKLKDFWK